MTSLLVWFFQPGYLWVEKVKLEKGPSPRSFPPRKWSKWVTLINRSLWDPTHPVNGINALTPPLFSRIPTDCPNTIIWEMRWGPRHGEYDCLMASKQSNRILRNALETSHFWGSWWDWDASVEWHDISARNLCLNPALVHDHPFPLYLWKQRKVLYISWTVSHKLQCGTPIKHTGLHGKLLSFLDKVLPTTLKALLLYSPDFEPVHLKVISTSTQKDLIQSLWFHF